MTRALRARLTKVGFQGEYTSRSRWPSPALPGRRKVEALAVAVCAALSLLMTGGATAAGAVAAPGSASVVPAPRPGRLMPAGLAGARMASMRLDMTRQPARSARNAFAVPGGPIVMASNPRTRTLYVVTLGGTVSLVSTARCNRLVRSGCKVVASVTGRAGFQFVAVDPSNDTVYALFGGTTGRGHTVKVFNGARCNARDTSDCRAVATVQVGRFPIGAALDRATHTLYVSNNYSNTVSLINTATCNAIRTAGCGVRIRAARVGKGPNLAAVDQARHTLYVPNNGPGGSDGNTGQDGTTVSLINTATCNATRQTGCHARAPVATVGNTPFGVTIAAGTVYAWNTGSDSVFSRTASLINAATCNATRHASCHRVKPTATVGAGPGPGASNPRTRTVYAVNIGDDTLSALSTAACNARHHAGCAAAAPTLATGALPAGVLTDAATDTVYVANLIDNTISVFNGAACNAAHRRGCRRLPPTVPLGGAPGTADVNAATGTVYVANQLTGKVQVINGAACNAQHSSGCHVAAAVKVGTPGVLGSDAVSVAVDQATDTVYAVNAGEGSNSTVRVINGAACNATRPAGCRRAPATIHVQKFPIGIAINQATDTVYVANTGSNTITVINGATCNGTHHSGCGQAPATLSVTGLGFGLAVNQATDTLYAVSANNTLAVINGATCNATDTSGCGQTPATVTVGSFPEGVAVDQATNTVYVANNANSNAPASVSVINGATCDGTNHSGCGRAPATVPAGRGAFGLAVDQAADTIIVASFSDASVSLINGAKCNATDTTGCHRTPAKKPAGSGSFWVAVSTSTGTAYVSAFNDNNLAVISIGHSGLRVPGS
jgi:YVTN family beta-propeller protein